jgi:terminase small subunit-like protein
MADDTPVPYSRAPINWTEDLITAICDALTEGFGINEIGAMPGMPSERAIYRHMAKDEAFGRRIARAREAQQEYEADKTVVMADQATPEDWQVVKLRIWARQWRAAKLAPKKYAERVQASDEPDGTITIEGGLPSDDA